MNRYTITRYTITQPLTLPQQADPKKADLSFSELKKRDFRAMGGDKGDLEFQGYTIENGTTTLYKPVLVTSLQLSPEDAYETAQEVLLNNYQSVGIECVEHS